MQSAWVRQECGMAVTRSCQAHGMLGYPPRILWSFKPPERARFLISSKYAVDLQALRDQGKQIATHKTGVKQPVKSV